jgi:hypothetical protein
MRCQFPTQLRFSWSKITRRRRVNPSRAAKTKTANSVLHVRDGEEAIHWLFGIGAYADRDTNHKPKLGCSI